MAEGPCVYVRPGMRSHRARVAVPAVSAAIALLAPSCTVTREAPDLVGQDVRISVIHTSDIHSRLFPFHFEPNRFEREDGFSAENGPFGGAARMATVISEVRDRAPRSIWLDSGDFFQGAPVFNLFSGEAEMRTLSAMGIDGAVIGNHEFDLGSQNLFEQIDNWAQFPLLAANYEFDDPPNRDRRFLADVVAPYMIYDLDGVTFGVIGMGNWSSMTGIFDGGNSLGIRPRDDRQVVQEYVNLLRPQVDVVVLLSHLGLSEDEGLAAYEVDDPNEDLPLEGVDLILGGHLHIVLNPPKVLPSDAHGNQTVLAHSGAFSKYVGVLDIVVRVGEDNADPDQRSRIVAFSYDNIPIDSRIRPHAGIADLLYPYARELHQTIDLDGVLAFVDRPEGLRIVRNDPSGGDSQLGNLVARSMQIRSGIEADFSLTNTMGIRADFERGPLTVEEMFNVFPFENSITVMYLSGSEVQETLDFVARRSSGRGCRTQVQVAGVWFDMVCGSDDCPGGAPACARNVHLGEDCRGGNPSGPIDPDRCAPIEPSGLYRVAVNDYIADGGSGFDVLERNTSKQYTDISLRDSLMDYLREQPTCDEDLVDFTDPDEATVVERWGQVACLDDSIEPHDGRIRPVFE